MHTAMIRNRTTRFQNESRMMLNCSSEAIR